MQAESAHHAVGVPWGYLALQQHLIKNNSAVFASTKRVASYPVGWGQQFPGIS